MKKFENIKEYYHTWKNIIIISQMHLDVQLLLVCNRYGKFSSL